MKACCSNLWIAELRAARPEPAALRRKRSVTSTLLAKTHTAHSDTRASTARSLNRCYDISRSVAERLACRCAVAYFCANDVLTLGPQLGRIEASARRSRGNENFCPAAIKAILSLTLTMPSERVEVATRDRVTVRYLHKLFEREGAFWADIANRLQHVLNFGDGLLRGQANR
jgi:hypothetical protein